jgi:hypothetical protein
MTKATERRPPVRLVASGVPPGEVVLGMVWTLRSTAPFSARAGVDLNGDGAITDYAPGTHKGQGNRDLTWACQRLACDPGPGLQCLPVQQERLPRVDARISKAPT